MAPNEGVEAVSTAKTDAAESGPDVGAPSSDGRSNGTTAQDATAFAPPTSNGNGSATSDGDPTNGTARAARKRTARQRAMLVNAEETALRTEAPGDPLLGSPPVDVKPVVAREDERADQAFDEIPIQRDGFDAPPDWNGSGEVAVAPVDTDAEWLEPAPTLSTAAVPFDLAHAAPGIVEPPRTAPLLLPVVRPEDDDQLLDDNFPGPPLMVPPLPKAPRRARPRVRKVTRVVRSVDAWSVFKVALIFFVSMGVVLMTAAVLLWNLAQSTGTLDNVEGFFREALNYDTFELKADPLFHAALVLTILFIVAGTGLSVVMAVLFNLIADLTGGIRVTVLEREVVARDDPRGRRSRRPARVQTRRPVTPPPASPPMPPPVVG
jgi:hypothetical protein